jgi:hypothetical protein
MPYLFSGYSGSCASSSGFGCSPWDDFFLDSSKVEYANTLYQDRYKRPIPERVAEFLRNQSGYCTRGSIDAFVKSHPPTTNDRTAGEVLEKQQEAGPAAQTPALNFPPPTQDAGGLPKWAIPAAAAGVGLLAIVLVMKRKKKASA